MDCVIRQGLVEIEGRLASGVDGGVYVTVV
jgi:hypothetical protein